MAEAFYRFLQGLGFHDPVHPPIEHAPMGLVIGGLIFALVSIVFRKKGLQVCARNCMILSFIFFFPGFLSGYMDWQHFYGGAPLLPIKMKIVLSVFLAMFLAGGIFFSRREGAGPAIALTFYALSFFSIVGIGYYGAQLVYGGKYGSASGSSSAVLRAGQEVYEFNCRSCHPNGGNIINPALPVVKSAKLKDFETFLAFNRNPRLPDGSKGSMPSFSKDKISDSQMLEMYDYVKSVEPKWRESK